MAREEGKWHGAPTRLRLTSIRAGSDRSRVKQVHRSLRIHYAAETQRAGAVFPRRHEQQFSMFVQAVGLREIPARALRLIVTAAAQNRGAGVLIQVFVGPLPDVAHEVLDSKRAGAARVRADVVGRPQVPAFLRGWNHTRVPPVPPRIDTAVRPLC